MYSYSILKSHHCIQNIGRYNISYTSHNILVKKNINSLSVVNTDFFNVYIIQLQLSLTLKTKHLHFQNVIILTHDLILSTLFINEYCKVIFLKASINN